MPQKELFILDEDKQWLHRRIAELEQQIQDLGPDFYDVFNQSSETWHDNAPFDALRDKQSVMFAEYSQLKSIRQRAALSLPPAKKGLVNIGSTIILEGKSYTIAGDWTPRAGKWLNDSLVVSAGAPLGVAVLGKKTFDHTKFGTIQAINTGAL